MRILPVLDLMGGRVVRGIGGRRHEYRPITSKLSASSLPLDVALAFRGQFGLTELYLADLDAIGGGSPAHAIYSSLRNAGFHLWVDAGIRQAAAAASLAEAGVEEIVFGLETLEGPRELTRACDLYGARVVFSLDLRDGEPLGDRRAWDSGDAWCVVERAVAAGAGRLIVLDLARVGSSGGIGTEELCRRVVQSFAGLEVIAGGGVRGIDDLRRLQDGGIGGVLLASVLHDGGLGPEQLANFTGLC
jgi:phosphoribosylformimino-5-aminoimidazole carboxamide ribotide isomerase